MRKITGILILALLFASCVNKVLVPKLEGSSWQVTTMPDLGELTRSNLKKQDIVDHGFIHTADRSWQLWACLRGTAVEQFLYLWDADSLTQPKCHNKGIALRVDTTFFTLKHIF